MELKPLYRQQYNLFVSDHFEYLSLVFKRYISFLNNKLTFDDFAIFAFQQTMGCNIYVKKEDEDEEDDEDDEKEKRLLPKE